MQYKKSKKFFNRRSVAKLVKKLFSVFVTAVSIFIIIKALSFKKDKRFVKEVLLRDEEKIKESELPVIVWWTGETSGSSRGEIHCKKKNLKCNVMPREYVFNENTKGAFLFYGPKVNFDDMPISKGQNNLIWGLFHDQGPKGVPMLMHAAALKLFNFSATFSRYSDVPFPLQHVKSKEDILTRKYYKEVSIKNSLLQILSPILYFQSDCKTMTDRDDYVKELMKHIPIDSYGDCLKNRRMPRHFTKKNSQHIHEDDILNFTSQYKFVIAIEDAVCDDYTTETVWRAIKAGVVPIYFGSPTAHHWLPNEKSAIYIKDYPAPDLMKEYLQTLLGNDSLYEGYLEHKAKQHISNHKLLSSLEFNTDQSDFVLMTRKFECVICEILSNSHKLSSKVNEISTSHYNCPIPVSALKLLVDLSSEWVKLHLMNGNRSEHLVNGRSSSILDCTAQPCVN